MKNKLIIFLAVLTTFFFLLGNDGYSQLTFKKEYWSPNFNISPFSANYEHDNIILTYSNGDAFIAFPMFIPSTSNHGITVSRLDEDGNVIWSNRFLSGPNGERYIMVTAEEKDGMVFLTGYSQDPQTGRPLYPFLLKFDASGNLVWNKSYSIALGAEPRDLIITQNNDICIIGNEGVENYRTFVCKIDPNSGSPIWFNAYDYSGTNTSTLCENNNQELILFYLTKQEDLATLRLDALGNIIPGFSKKINIPSSDDYYPADLVFDPISGEYILYTEVGQYAAPTLFGFNSSGNINWTKSANSSMSWLSFGGHLERGTDGYYISGENLEPSISNHTIKYLAKTNLNGDFLWIKGVGSLLDYNYKGRSHSALVDDGIWITYISNNQGVNVTYPLTVVKTNLLGELTADACETINIPVSTKMIPNYTLSNISPTQKPINYLETEPFEFEEEIIEMDVLCIDSCKNDIAVWIEDPQGTLLGPTITLCEGEMISLVTNATTTGSAPFSYLWNNNTSSTSSSINVSTSGTYSITVTDADGCVAIATINVIVDPIIQPQVFSPAPDICENDPAFNLWASPTSGNWTGTGITNNQFNPSLAGEGIHTLTYTLEEKCTLPTSVDVVVHPLPNVQATYPTYTVCCGSGSFFLGAEWIPQNNIYWVYDFFSPVDGWPASGDPQDIPPMGGKFAFPPQTTPAIIVNHNPVDNPNFNLFEFDPCAVGPGTYPIIYTYKDQNGCEASATMNVVVTDDSWHQTTSQTVALDNLGDIGNDIYTDGEGNVYATGSFYSQTTFDDQLGNQITINAINPDLKHFYTVCYNECGELQWVLYDKSFASNGRSSEGFGVVENSGNIYVGMNYSEETNLWLATPTTSNPISNPVNNGSLSSSNGNIALLALNGNTSSSPGDVIAINDTYPNFYGRALDAKNEVGDISELFFCGRSIQVVGGAPGYSAFGGYKQFDLVLGFNGGWINQSVESSDINIANDIKWDERLGWALTTGTFSNKLTFAPGSVSISTLAVNDAFVVAMKPQNGDIVSFNFWNLGIDNNGHAEGTCLTSDDNNYFYLGGNFKGKVTSPFGYNIPGANSISPNGSSYIFSDRISPGNVSFTEIFNPSSYTKLTGLDAEGNQIAFVGHYSNGSPQITGSSSIAAINSPLSGNSSDYLFAGEIDLNNSANWNKPRIINSTILSNGNPEWNHESTRISVGNDFAFLTGKYHGKMSYFQGNPINGDLTASGTNNNPQNAFFLRQDLNTNQLRRGRLKDEEKDEKKGLLISAYPNPTHDLTTISIEGYTSDSPIILEVYNSTGQAIYSLKTIQNKIELDMKQFDQGVYIAKLNLDHKVKTIKIIKD